MKEKAFQTSGSGQTGRSRLAAAVLAFSAAASLVGGAAAAIVSGGSYQVESSVFDNGGGQWLDGGDYASRGAIGQITMPENIGFVQGGEYVNRVGFYNPPYFTYQKGLTSSLALASGELALSIPPNSVDKETFDISINKDSLRRAISADPSKINEATNKMLNNEGGWAQLFARDLTEMAIFDDQSYYKKPLAKSGLLTMRYRDDDSDGVLDGTDPPIRVDTLDAWVLDEKIDMWVPLPGAGADSDSKTFSVYFGGPGLYTIMGTMADSVKDVFAFPVPFRPNGPNAGTDNGQTGVDGDCVLCGVNFTKLPQKGEISIYSLDGQLVKKIHIEPSLLTGQNQLKWNVRNTYGSKVASGVYVWRVVSGANSKTGKLMVIW